MLLKTQELPILSETEIFVNYSENYNLYVKKSISFIFLNQLII